jgi:2-polyprenyl-3-methyl-5-hydroxy-6-metoxy-1,4-benzoquinol methylase
MRPVSDRTNRDLASEWDQVAYYRLKSILEGGDKTYSEIIVPAILSVIDRIWSGTSAQQHSYLDVGCGVGHLSHVISVYDQRAVVDAIDISETSIEIARRNFDSRNVVFVWSSLEDFTADRQYDVLLANMFLMNCLDYRMALSKFNKMLKVGGFFIATIPHPCYWPRYWQYERSEWFDYCREIAIETFFKTSTLGETQFKTTHFHRPLEMYLKSIGDSAFVLFSVNELAHNIIIEGANLPRHLLLSGFKIKDI